jgi:hypothetical protein
MRHALALLLAVLPFAGASPARAAAADTALEIGSGSVAHHQVVAVGRNLVVSGRVTSDVAALNGAVTITGEVTGDVIVLGGNARLADSAEVGGDVFVLGGTLEAAPGSTISGRSVAYPDASAAWLTLLEAPTLGLSATSPLILGAKLALLAAWLLLTLLLFAIAGRGILATAERLEAEPFRCFSVGLTGVLSLTLTALLFSLFAAALVGVPLLVMVVVFALLLKLWGLTAVFHAFGLFLSRRVLKRRFTPLNTAVLGLLVLGTLKLIPVVGLLTWHVASLIGVGGALVTKLGREEPWFEAAAEAR